MRWRRFFKKLEFAFPLRTVFAPTTVVGQPLRLPSAKTAGGAPALQFVCRRDHALESQARELLRSLGAEELAKKVRVEWNPRLKTCAGRADYREKLISLNPLLLEIRVAADPAVVGRPLRLPFSEPASDALALQFPEINEIDRTLRHELAHLLAQWRAGRRRIAPHGEEWRQACRDLGIADEARCHNLPFASKTLPPRYVYRCPNCKEEFPRVRRIRRAIACLACCRKSNGGDFDPRFRLKLTTKL